MSLHPPDRGKSHFAWHGGLSLELTNQQQCLTTTDIYVLNYWRFKWVEKGPLGFDFCINAFSRQAGYYYPTSCFIFYFHFLSFLLCFFVLVCYALLPFFVSVFFFFFFWNQHLQISNGLRACRLPVDQLHWQRICILTLLHLLISVFVVFCLDLFVFPTVFLGPTCPKLRQGGF